MTDLGQLATALSTIEDWLRQGCTARHAGQMADRVHEAWSVIDDLADQAAEPCLCGDSSQPGAHGPDQCSVIVQGAEVGKPTGLWLRTLTRVGE